MSTSEINGRELDGKATAAQQPDLSGNNPPAAMIAPPDVALIAKLANEFFAALPYAQVPQTVAAHPVEADSAAVTGVAPPSGGVPDYPREMFSFPGVPSLTIAQPAVSSPAPVGALTEADFRAIAASFGSSPYSVAPNASITDPAVSASSPDPGAAEKVSYPGTVDFPAIGEMFSFPGVPGMQSAPGIPALPSSPPAVPATENDLTALAGTSVPGSAGQPLDLKEATPSDGEQTKTLPSTIGAFAFQPDVVPNVGAAKRPFDPQLVRRDFPILQERVHGKPLIWLDNAATTQKPKAVIDRLAYFYQHENSNVHRAAHTLAARSTDAYESAREKVRRFLNAPSAREIIFVRGTTEGVNLVAKSWGHRNVYKGDEVVVTWLEHHANIVPWQQLCSEKGACLRVAPVNDRGEIILEEYEKLLGPRTRIVAFSQVSNALGTVTPAREMIEMAHRHGARVLVDGAQSVAHMPTDVQAVDCDFFVFSGHKIFAPTGIGVVFGKSEVLENTPPWQGGGSMILDVTFEKTIYNVPPARFEAGTGNIADAVGLGAALDYVDEVGLENIASYEHELLEYATAGLLTVPGLRLIGTAREKAGVLSFVLADVPTEEVGKALDQEGIAVRAGHHCAQPILRRMGVESTVRPSLALYNTRDDVDTLVQALLRMQAGRSYRSL